MHRTTRPTASDLIGTRRPLTLLMGLAGISCSILACGSSDQNDDTAPTETRPPVTDIYLGNISISNGAVSISDVVNITRRPGYDNQPAFTHDGESLLYTSARGDQTDIYRWDLREQQHWQLTHTSESEYSPTPMPDGVTFSVIQVERDSTQRLWHFDFDGGNQGLVVDDVAPVGYHAWGANDIVAMFVLGNPSTLQVANTSTGQVKLVTESIGRSLHKIPNEPAISFVHKDSTAWTIRRWDLINDTITDITPTLREREDYAWLPNGSVIMGKGSELLQWTPADPTWRRIADLGPEGLSNITRLAIDPTGQHIAIVAVPIGGNTP